MVSYLFKFVGIIFLLIILNNINLEELLEILQGAEIQYFLLALILGVPFFVLKIVRWKYILKKSGIKYSFYNSFITYGAGLLFGQVTPGQLGEFYRGVILSKQGHNFSIVTTTVVFERFCDLIFILIFAIPGIFIYFGKPIFSFFLISILILPLAYFLNHKKQCLSLFSFLSSSQILNKYTKRFNDSFILFKSFLKDFQVIRKIAMITLFVFILFIFRIYLLLISLNLELPLFHLILGSFFSSLIALIPISYAGIGTRDAALILVFLKSGQSHEGAIALSTMILALNIIIPIFWGLPSWFMSQKLKILND